MKRTVSTIAIIMVCIAFWGCQSNEGNGVSDFAGGSGTQNDPWQIVSAEQLDSVRNYLNRHFVLIADIDLSNYANWEPIGVYEPMDATPESPPNPQKAFSGTFDGNNHTISNISINRPMEMTPTSMMLGLFGCVLGTPGSPGHISNLKIRNADMTGLYMVASLVGLQGPNFMVENIALQGTNTIRGSQGLGGIVGNSAGVVKRCTAVATIEVLGDGGACAGIIAGGLEGGSLIECTAEGGSITATGNAIWALGGVSGAPFEAVEITNCKSQNVTITASGNNNENIGGLVGFTGTYNGAAKTTVTDCTVVNAAINVSRTTTRVGGLIGGSRASSTDPALSSFAVNNCSTAGTITGGTTSVGSIVGYAYHSTVESSTSTITWNGGTLKQIGHNE